MIVNTTSATISAPSPNMVGESSIQERSSTKMFESVFRGELDELGKTTLIAARPIFFEGVRLPFDSDNSGESLGDENAGKLANFLDKVGFLDRVVESLIASSGQSQWVSDSMRVDMKFALRKELAEVVFPDMSWSEAMRLIMSLKLKIRHDELLPLQPGEAAPGSILEDINRRMKRHLEAIKTEALDMRALHTPSLSMALEL